MIAYLGLVIQTVLAMPLTSIALDRLKSACKQARWEFMPCLPANSAGESASGSCLQAIGLAPTQSAVPLRCTAESSMTMAGAACKQPIRMT
jgi:hypothetical protein